MDAAIVKAIRGLLMEGLQRAEHRLSSSAGADCRRRERGHLRRGEAMVLDA